MASKALIATSQTWPSTAALPALFREIGIDVVSFSPGLLGLGGFVTERLRCSRDPQRAASQLRDLLASRSFDWIVVADELLLAALLETQMPGSDESWLPIAKSDSRAVALALSKYALVERARELGIAVPESRFARTTVDALAIAAEFGFPIVVKGDRGFAGSQVRICADYTAFRTATREFFSRYERILVQRHIAGKPVSVCVAYDRGRIAAYKAYAAECCYPDAHSASTAHRFFAHPAIERAAAAIGKATGFHGFAGIDFMSDGRDLYALEINPRPTIGFAGTVTNRSFFAPVLRRLLAGEAPARALAYDGRDRLQLYFPGHLFYILSHIARPGPFVWHRFFTCLREARARDARLIAWEISRFMYDETIKQLPGLRDAIGRLRAPAETSPRSLSGGEPIGTTR